MKAAHSHINGKVVEDWKGKKYDSVYILTKKDLLELNHDSL